MKRAIALWGSANIGKSSTLKIVHNKLSKLASGILPEVSEAGKDLRDIFIIDGVKLDIETQGDPGSRLECSLKLFLEHDCKVIICATRTRGSTTEFVNNLQPQYHVSWRGHSSVSGNCQGICRL
jgi:hypothetical protein